MAYIIVGGVIGLGLGGWVYLRRVRRRRSVKHDHTETVGHEMLKQQFPEEGDS